MTVPGTAATRRFYARVAVALLNGRYALRLDDRQPHTPKGAPLVAPTAALVELIAAEWRAQGDTIDYSTMPATRLAHTAIDGVSATRQATIDTVTRFAASDLLCYFADDPASLVERQRAAWSPLIAWAREALGLDFTSTSGIVHRQQRPETLEKVSALVAETDDFALAGLAFGASLFGSAILVLALPAGRINAAEAIAAARLDDIFQEERWGVDVETVGRTRALEADAAMLERWFKALG